MSRKRNQQQLNRGRYNVFLWYTVDISHYNASFMCHIFIYVYKWHDQMQFVMFSWRDNALFFFSSISAFIFVLAVILSAGRMQEVSILQIYKCAMWF